MSSVVIKNVELNDSPSLTTPKISTSINDSAGNELIEITEVSSAVNFLSISNSATGSGVTLGAGGDDTDVSLTVHPKGTGTLQLGSSTNHTISINGAYTLPSEDGISAGQVLQTDGFGALSFATPSSGGDITNSSATFSNVTGAVYNEIVIDIKNTAGSAAAQSITQDLITFNSTQTARGIAQFIVDLVVQYTNDPSGSPIYYTRGYTLKAIFTINEISGIPSLQGAVYSDSYGNDASDIFGTDLTLAINTTAVRIEGSTVTQSSGDITSVIGRARVVHNASV